MKGKVNNKNVRLKAIPEKIVNNNVWVYCERQVGKRFSRSDLCNQLSCTLWGRKDRRLCSRVKVHALTSPVLTANWLSHGPCQPCLTP